jgi:hypothetical protein
MKAKIRPAVWIVTCLICAAIAVLAFWATAGSRSIHEGFDRSANVLSPDSRKILESGDHFILYSLDPTGLDFPNHSASKSEVFHNYAVLGKTEIQNQKQRMELLHAFYKGIADSDDSVAACFNPRHGIRATLAGETVDLVICFQCLSMETYTEPDARAGSLLTTRSPKSTFNKALERAHLPVANEN